MKKTASILNVVVMVVVMVAVLSLSLVACGNKDSTSTDKEPEPTVGLEFKLLDDDTYGISDYYGTSKDVYIPSTYKDKDVTVILEGAFEEAEIMTVTIGNNITKIEDRAFCDSWLIGVDIPDSVLYIGESAFKDTSLLWVTIGKNIGRIEKDAFETSDNIYEVYNKSSLKIKKVLSKNDESPLGRKTFEYYRYTDAELHDFGGIGKYIVDLYTAPYTSRFSKEDGWLLYTKDGDVSVMAYMGEQTVLVVPDKVTNIKSIDSENLKEVTIGKGVKAIGDDAFYGCDSLEVIHMPASMESIGEYAFAQCVSLKSIVIPEGVQTLQDFTFYGCTALEEITLPVSLKRMERYYGVTFYGCTSLKTIHYAGTKAQWEAVETYGILDDNLSAYTIQCKDGNISK